MPFILSERLPLPTLKMYTVTSLLLFLFTIVYVQGSFMGSSGGHLSFWSIVNGNNVFIWIFFNMVYCILLLFGKMIQIVALGALRESEQQDIQDFFWNFVFYKFIFIFGVYNAQTISDIMYWITWFSLLGLLHQFGLLCKDRYDFLTSKPSIPRHCHIKLVALSVTTYILSYGMFVLAFHYGLPEGRNVFMFMIAECILLNLKCCRVLLRYFRYFMDTRHHGHSSSLEYKMQFDYYSELVLELVILVTDLIYHVHMLIWSNGFLTLASLVLYWNIRTIFQELKQCSRKHKTRKRIVNAVKEKFRAVSAEDLTSNEDHCVICWEGLKSARILPCGHLFHHTCLCSWLQQDMSCPTCRLSLGSSMGIEGGQMDDRENISELLLQRRNQGNSFFHFDGSRIASWLPTFSIEFFHYNGDDVTSDQELEEMAERLYSTFPSVPREEIWSDLRRTRSVEETADNVISRNLLSSSSPEVLEVETSQYSDPGTSADDSSSTETDDLESADAPFSDASPSETQPSTILGEDAEHKNMAYSIRRRKFISDARRMYLEKASEETGASGMPHSLPLESRDHERTQTNFDAT